MTVASIGNAALQSALAEFERASDRVNKAVGPPAEAPIEFTEATVELMLARRSVESALRLVKTADEVFGEALKILK